MTGKSAKIANDSIAETKGTHEKISIEQKNKINESLNKQVTIAVDLTPYRSGALNGGIVPLTFSALRGLSEIEGVRIILMTSPELKDLSSLPAGKNIQVKAVPPPEGGGDDSCSLSDLIGEKPDVLYCPFSAINYYDEKVWTVSHIHDIQHYYMPFFFAPEEVSSREAFYQKLIKKQPQLVMTSDYTRESFLKAYQYPENRMLTVHSAIQNRFSGVSKEEAEKALERIGLSEIHYALYPANLWPHKNHIGLLTAFSMFRHAYSGEDQGLSSSHSVEDQSLSSSHSVEDQSLSSSHSVEDQDLSSSHSKEDSEHSYHLMGKDLHLVLCGFDKSEAGALIEDTQRMGIGDRVHFLGYVSETELAGLYRGCLFLIFPSLYEGFGIPVAEAMQEGVSVLISRETSLPEVAGDCAFYFDPYNPADICRVMEYFLSHPEEAEEKKRHYRDQLSRFSYQRFVQSLYWVLTASAYEGGSDFDGISESGECIQDRQ